MNEPLRVVTTDERLFPQHVLASGGIVRAGTVLSLGVDWSRAVRLLTTATGAP